jgi:hypothetical protein
MTARIVHDAGRVLAVPLYADETQLHAALANLRARSAVPGSA